MAFEKLRFKYHMIGLKTYSEELVRIIPTRESIDDSNINIIERYSRRAVSHGRKARDLSSKVGVTLDENFASVLSSAEGFQESCKEYREWKQNKN
jgi:hypothetical protein